MVDLTFDVQAFRAQIPALATCIYTNTAGFGPLPRPVWEELRRREEEILARGLDVVAHDPAWCAVIEEWRARLAACFGAGVDEIAFARALGEGLNVVIGGMEWQPGDEIVITDQEHPTGLLPALNLAARCGVRVRRLEAGAHAGAHEVGSGGGSDAENLERFAALLGPRTRLVAVSAVTTELGVRLPFARFCAMAEAARVPVYLDLAQAAGQFPLDLRATGCAFAAASGSKWLLGPLGTAFFYVRSDWTERLRVSWTGSHSGAESPGGGIEWSAGARRFEFGGRHWPLLGAMLTAVDWVHAIGLERIQASAAALATRLKQALLELPGVTVLTPMLAELSTGIVTARMEQWRNGDVITALRERWRIRSRPTQANGVRFSLAFFNTEEEVDQIVAALAELAR